MKAILVIDVDDKYLNKEISLIKFADDNAIYCNAIYRSEKLKPMPQYKKSLCLTDNKSIMISQPSIYESGWNDCIDEILGEENAQDNSQES